MTSLCTVDGVVIDSRLRLVCTDGIEFTFERPIRLLTEIDSLSISPGEWGEADESALRRLQGDVIQRYEVDEARSRLTIWFLSGARIEADPDPRFESWHVREAGQRETLALPDGGVARFG